MAISFAMLATYSVTIFASFSLALVLFGFAFSLFFPITLSMITRSTPKSMIGASVGAYETVFGIGWAVGPVVSGIAADLFSVDIPYISMFIIGMILPLFALSGTKQRNQLA
ncbi:MAG: MFS transporter [Nitrososphaerales archaeon]